MAKRFVEVVGCQNTLVRSILIPCPLFLVLSEKHKAQNSNFSFKVNKIKTG